jgi:hypothetical protein
MSQKIKVVATMIMNTKSPMKNRICFWCAEGFLFRPLFALRDMVLFCRHAAPSANRFLGLSEQPRQ